ncbi:MAG: carboxylesterase/lipase family protein [Actinomycetota bacterium]
MTAVARTLGIRYATAARFEAPVMVPYDPAAQPGDTHGPLSPQVPGMLEQLLGVDAGSMDEDCLYLNVFRPEGAAPGADLPVLFWIHGGAYLTGGGSIGWYEGSRLAARGNVVVTINYRLGALGFLGGGNWGTLDQICALRWVREHVGTFGGDPANVTIFGESAGGSAVVSLLASPEAQGLFHRAWAMSPSILQLRDLETAMRWQGVFLQHAGVDSVQAVRDLPLEAVLQAQSATIATPNTRYDMFSPAAGGNALPDDLLAAAAASPVPLSIGTNRDESLLFLAFAPDLAAADADRWTEFAASQFGERAADAQALYEAARPGARPVALMAAVQTDQDFRRPAQALAEAREAAGAPTWMYWFTWASPAFGGALGSAHALDIPFAFDNLDAPGTAMMLGDGPELQGIANRFADELSGFARDGKPSWQAFDTADRATLRIDAEVVVLLDPEPELRALHS